MKHIITIDVGTMSIVARVFDEEGETYATSGYEYSAIYLPEGHVEQDTKDWKDGLKHVLSEVSTYINEENIEIDGISITSQRASVIPVNKYGNPLYNAITWQDKRSIGVNKELLEKMSMKEIYKRTGLRSNPYFSLPKMIWLKDNAPLIYSKTHKILGVQDYIVYLLTGEFKTDASQAARTMLMNIKTFEWDDTMLEVSGITKDKLPEILPPGSVAGHVTEEYAEEIGLVAGIPVIMAGGDQQTAALALDVMEEGRAEVNTGTGSFIISHSDQPYFDEEARILCSASAMPGKWINEASIFNTGSIYRWFRNEFYGDNTDFAEMNEQASQSPIGANGVMLIPHFEGSAAPFWNPYAKGLFFNLSLGTTRKDMTRAILEGIAMEISNNLTLIEENSSELKSISVAGGLTRSDLFNQIQSDISFKEIIRYEDTEASSLGAAMSAFVTLGIYETYHDAFDGIIRQVGKITYDPIAENHLRYNHVAARKFELYDALNDNEVYEKFLGKI